MRSLDAVALRRELLLERAVRRRLDELIRRANKTTLLLEGNLYMEVGQLRNLLNVAVESGSLEVVMNFVRYQIARGGRAWGTTPQSFGHQVIEDLRGPLAGLADGVAEEVAVGLADGGDAPSPDERAELRAGAHMRLAQLYLGYMQRAFYFARRAQTFDGLREVGHA